ncbi:MAG: hypothetical protein ACOC80_16825 [Petrotogales bacterium]
MFEMLDYSNKKVPEISLKQLEPKVLLLIIVLFMFSLGGIGFIAVSVSPQNILLIIMFTLLIIFPLIRYIQTKDFFDTFQIISFGCIFYYVFGGLYLQIVGTDLGNPDLTGVYLCVIFGYLFFCVAYYSRLGGGVLKLLPRMRTQVNRSRLVYLACAFLILSILASLYFGLIEVRLYPTVAGLLKNIGHLSKLSTLLFLANYLLKPNRKTLLLLFFAVGVALCYEFIIFEAERRTTLRWIVTMLVYWHYRRSRFKLRTLLILGAAGLALMFSLKIVSGFYHFPRSQWSPDLFSEITDRYMNRFDNPKIGIARSLEAPGAVENFAEVIRQVNSGQIDLLWGTSYYRLLFIFMPREIWPDKPLHIGRQIPVLVTSSSGAGAQPVTLMGEMYLNFGYIGILVNMALIGIMCKFFYLLLTKNKQQDSLPAVPATLVYAVTVGFLLQSFRGGFHMIVLEYVIFNMFPLLLGMKYFMRRPRHL